MYTCILNVHVHVYRKSLLWCIVHCSMHKPFHLFSIHPVLFESFPAPSVNPCIEYQALMLSSCITLAPYGTLPARERERERERVRERERGREREREGGREREREGGRERERDGIKISKRLNWFCCYLSTCAEMTVSFSMRTECSDSS